jgi:hypothetical protein
MTSRFFKGLIKRNDASSDKLTHPFGKGALSFDDYSYKFYNESLFNQKAVK